MQPTKKGRPVANIGDFVKKNQEIIQSILPAYAMSGCDSIARYHGIGKATVHSFFYKKPRDPLSPQSFLKKRPFEPSKILWVS